MSNTQGWQLGNRGPGQRTDRFAYPGIVAENRDPRLGRDFDKALIDLRRTGIKSGLDGDLPLIDSQR